MSPGMSSGMKYQVLARKWRPQDFGSLVGQEPIVTALTNALRDQRIAQAYLFSGIRGVGKTTAARIFAKALNCETGPTPSPCNTCSHCLEIPKGQNLDVLEIDAATYSKVEQVRELTESLRYGPASSRYKVVVLDEVHRLSRQAFDALLKIIEEPPAHLVFVFATTEIDAVPATILSRCQEFHFRRVTAETLTAHLSTLAVAEDIKVSSTALRLIARAGEGSVRDSVALLDQLATFGAGQIADADAARLLGGLDTALFLQLLAALLEGRSPEVTGVCREIEERGWDPRRVYAQFLSYCRDGLHLALGADASTIDLPEEDAKLLAAQVSRTTYESLLRVLHLLLESEATVRRTDAGTLAVEIAWLRACELPKLLRVQSLLRGLGPSSPEDETGGRGTPDSAGAGSPSDGSASAGVETAPSVAALRDVLRAERPALAAALERLAELEIAGDALLIRLPTDDTFAREQVERASATLDAAVHSVLGDAGSWRITPLAAAPRKTSVATSPQVSAPRPTRLPRASRGAPAAPSDAGSSQEPAPAERNAAPADEQRREENPDARNLRDHALQDPTVQAVLDIFDTDIESVESKG
jgi:DNA polymerase-3 subunit gamma/tau